MKKRIVVPFLIVAMSISILVGCRGVGDANSQLTQESQLTENSKDSQFAGDSQSGIDSETFGGENNKSEGEEGTEISSSEEVANPTDTETQIGSGVDTPPESEEPVTGNTEPPVVYDPEADTPSNCGALQVVRNLLCDSKGDKVYLHGLSTHGLSWFPSYVNEAAFQEFREEWGANVIRLAMYTADYNGYCTGGDKEGLKNLIRKGVEYATENDMYVIVDWHILSDGNPNTYKSEAKAFFAEMSEELANHNNVLYEICNEPNGGTSWSDIKAYAEEVIPVIRANDSDAIIIVGTPNWSQYVKDAAANPITGYENIMYALHFYAATHTDWLRNDMVEAIHSGLPIFVTEFGICDASGNGAIDEYQANEWIKVMNENAVSYCGWNISNKNETSAIFKSSCNKTSGWTEDDLSASGKWMYEMLRNTKLGD